ncbi:hypothetical protein HB803_13840 [Listeria welshimeri]|nr:hypothetical protein [Listeria welshimeri]
MVCYQSLKGQKESTYEKRYESVNTLSRWIGDEKMISLNSAFLEELFFTLKEKGIDGVSKGYSKNSLESFRQTLNIIFNYCLKNNVLSDNLLESVRRPKYQQTVQQLKDSLESVDQKYLAFDELRSLLNYSIIYEELPLSTFYHVLFYTGCRISEALAYNQKILILTIMRFFFTSRQP